MAVDSVAFLTGSSVESEASVVAGVSAGSVSVSAFSSSVCSSVEIVATVEEAFVVGDDSETDLAKLEITTYQ